MIFVQPSAQMEIGEGLMQSLATETVVTYPVTSIPRCTGDRTIDNK